MEGFDAKISFTWREEDEEPTMEPFLPEQSESNSSKPTLVLDMDNTLIFTKSTEKDNEFWVAKRPGLDTFLQEMSDLYEIVLWTGSQQEYASAVVDEVLDPNNEIFSHRLYKQYGAKDLGKLGRDLRKMVMLEDSYEFHGIPEYVRANVIIISPFIALLRMDETITLRRSLKCSKSWLRLTTSERSSKGLEMRLGVFYMRLRRRGPQN